MDRRKFLLFPLAAIPVAGYARYVEPTWLELAHEDIALPGVNQGKRVRIAQLSDLHASDVVPHSLIEQAIDLALAQKPDVVCLTGDYITINKNYDAAWYARTLRRIADYGPCFASLGNHDGGWGTGYSTDAVVDLLESASVPTLINSWSDLTFRSQRIRIVGLGDLWTGQFRPEAAFGEIPDDGVPTVVLSHNPDSKAPLADYPWHLMLSGHTHGGQVVFPVLGFSPAPVHDRRYIKGLKPWNNRLIYVNAGVGNLDGVRFNCRPQVSIIDLHG